jgi:tetrahydromethanopterin S-methyltransferase subunit E
MTRSFSLVTLAYFFSFLLPHPHPHPHCFLPVVAVVFVVSDFVAMHSSPSVKR